MNLRMSAMQVSARTRFYVIRTFGSRHDSLIVRIGWKVQPGSRKGDAFLSLVNDKLQLTREFKEILLETESLLDAQTQAKEMNVIQEVLEG